MKIDQLRDSQAVAWPPNIQLGFYDCDFVNRFVDRRILRTVCGKSFLSGQTYEIGMQLQNKTQIVLLSKEYFPRQSGSL
jgi:hypothetical protein